MFYLTKRLIIILIVGTLFVVLLINYITLYIRHESFVDPNGFLPMQLVDNSPQKLLNITFQYVLNNEHLCGDPNESLHAIFIVTSYFGNVEVRSSMRRAFSNKDLQQQKLRRVFLLGSAPSDKYTKQSSIDNEGMRFGDIIQGSFKEAYRNLTYKHIMGLKWATKYCSNSKYIIKMDDDIVVNMYMLNSILDSLDKLTHRQFIAGYVLRNMLPIREPANKWYVTNEEYSLRTYPSFVSGWFYITNIKTAKNLVALSNYEKYFWIDDLFVTGLLAHKLKLMLFDISKYFTANSEFLQCCLQDFDRNLICDISIGPNGGDVNMFYTFNNKAQKCISKSNCQDRLKPLSETCVAEKRENLGRGLGKISNFNLG